MFQHLEKLRQKSDREKKQIAFFVAFIFSLTIFIFWFFAVYPGFQKQKELDKKIETMESGPTTSFASIFKDKMGQMKEQISKIKETVSSFSTDLEYYSATTTASTTQEVEKTPQI